ncbi:guanine nucleotide-binding protein subunit alpha [Cyberlindnera jadinii NRRL Y-1542]|uniref:Guanine nucleotide-binding protein alpha-2 subunit n=1 Tax=Cyberlindnera jadinii (strain ATCC 18201 / CBS 1600 / BCRC 20928 / JCM 3617 / NBRC 0987 / NRRL Y-1542) TaxID=983966 RepID=A0A1E4RW62_CYBJN|nr:guanine nucleotide binding protein, alpha subunit [Cyberlindnera jadinii NRRL Y-1542]ODV71509.1 guanine nucleotide binding protein, alpha subunit [Cyberlindnera jadinii NRRL Y-1542]
MKNGQLTNAKDSHEYTKVLLLGTGESGKSTILQQLRILHSNGFTEQELIDFKPFIFSNIVSSAKDLVAAYSTFNVKLDEDDEWLSEQDLEDISQSSAPMDPNASFDPKLAKQIIKLWKSQSTLKLLREHRQDFYMMDSASYFFGELERISQPGFIPNDTDVIRTRKKTSGIFDLKFELDGLKLHIFDVGGQRSERKKWIYCFDNVAAIIFCVALSEYDQVLLEDKNKNRLEESLTLFDSVVNSRWFSRCSIILFLNKIDIFVDKLPYSPLEKHFPDYKGGDDPNNAAKYILWRFTKVNRSGLPIYPYITQATDRNSMKLVFVVVRESIFSNILQDTGLLS